MYNYSIYGLIVSCNKKMPLLTVSNDDVQADLLLDVEYENIENDDWFVAERNGMIQIKIGSWAIYDIAPANNRIYCKATDFNSFFSTLFNIPFSVYLFSKGDILFHCSSVTQGKNVIAFSGDKGMGKSTLVSVLKNTGYFNMYGDDTLRISKNLTVYPPHNLIKLTQKTVDSVGIAGINERNITGKLYDRFNSDCRPSVLKAVFHIYRSEISDFDINVFDGKNMAFHFIKNIVGMSSFPKNLLKKAMKEIPPDEFTIYRLNIPNNMEFLIRNSNRLAEKLLSFLERHS